MAKTVVTEQATAAAYAGLEPEQLIRMYRLMYLSRRTDDREILLKATAEDLLPDFRRRPRGIAGSCRNGAETRL